MAKNMTTIENFSEQEILEYGCKTRPSIWAQRYTALKGRPYTFKGLLPDGKLDLSKKGLIQQRQFLQQPLDDQHPWTTHQKSRQLGLTENSTRECLWFADQHDYTKQVYVFPTDQQVKDFSRTRVSETIDSSNYLLKRMNIDPYTRKKIDKATEEVDNVKLKKINKSFIFFRSGATPRAGEGIDCDVVYFDELDRMARNVTVAFNETIAQSLFGWRRDISTPSLPNVGVNDSFEQSDRNYWFMKCPHCNNFFTLILEYPKSIIELPKKWINSYPHIFNEWDTHAYVCTKCYKPVDNATRINGFWHPIYPSRNRIRGYQLTQLIAAWISATKLMQKKTDYKLTQLFINYVIGLPYLGDNIILSETDIQKCINYNIENPHKITRRNVVVGGDWGNESWQIVACTSPDYPDKIIILDLKKIEEVPSGENPHITESIDLFRTWNAELGVYDAGYGKDRNWELRQTFPGKIFSCFYPNNFTDYTKDFEDRWEDNSGRVSVDRTMTIKLSLKQFKDNKIIIPKWVAENPLFPKFTKHLTNMVSIKDIDEDKHGVEVITERIGSLPGGDHFGHAWNYLLIGIRKIKDNIKNDFIF